VFVIDSITGPELFFIIDSFGAADLLFIIDSLTIADVRLLIEDSQDEKREKVEGGTGTKQIHQIELNPKVTDDRRGYKKVGDGREKREKVGEGR
jgi:hypothetical protein